MASFQEAELRGLGNFCRICRRFGDDDDAEDPMAVLESACDCEGQARVGCVLARAQKSGLWTRCGACKATFKASALATRCALAVGRAEALDGRAADRGALAEARLEAATVLEEAGRWREASAHAASAARVFELAEDRLADVAEARGVEERTLARTDAPFAQLDAARARRVVALEAAAKSGRNWDGALGDALRARGAALVAAGRFADGAPLLKRAARVETRDAAPTARRAARLREVAVACLGCRDFETAERAARDSAAAFDALGSLPRELARAYSLLGAIHEEAGSKDGMAEAAVFEFACVAKFDLDESVDCRGDDDVKRALAAAVAARDKADLGRAEDVISRVRRTGAKGATDAFCPACAARPGTHATHLFLAKFDVLPHLAPIMLLAGFLAAIVHDFNHPGTNNAFEVKIASPLAVRHSDDSVLERHHLAAAFEILYRKEYDVLEALDGDERKQLRGAMIDVVLATDLRGNFDFIKKLEKIPRKGPEPDAPWPLPRDAKDDPKLALTVAVKFADIGHALKPFDQHEKWSMLVTEEFYKIGDREKALGVPVSFLCDRDKDTNMAKSQIGYFKFVCNPFYKAVAELVDAKLGPFDNLESNLWQWFLLYKGEALPTAAPGKKSAKRTRRASAAILRPHVAANGAAAPAVAANGGAPDLLAASGRAPTPRRHSSVLSKKEVDSSLAGGKKLRVANEI